MISVVNATGNLTCYECAQSTLGTVDGDKSGNCFNEDSTTPFRINCDACYIRKWFLNLFNQNFKHRFKYIKSRSSTKTMANGTVYFIDRNCLKVRFN